MLSPSSEQKRRSFIYQKKKERRSFVNEIMAIQIKVVLFLARYNECIKRNDWDQWKDKKLALQTVANAASACRT